MRRPSVMRFAVYMQQSYENKENTMKKLAFLVLFLSLGLVSVGCEKPADRKIDKNAKEMKKEIGEAAKEEKEAVGAAAKAEKEAITEEAKEAKKEVDEAAEEAKKDADK